MRRFRLHRDGGFCGCIGSGAGGANGSCGIGSGDAGGRGCAISGSMRGCGSTGAGFSSCSSEIARCLLEAASEASCDQASLSAAGCGSMDGMGSGAGGGGNGSGDGSIIEASKLSNLETCGSWGGGGCTTSSTSTSFCSISLSVRSRANISLSMSSESTVVSDISVLLRERFFGSLATKVSCSASINASTEG
ncbi:hypothetical protein [Ktedonospora formicarum]|uniref:hypothetical protein n=1 Tax=Ktedonospora formicarum TaxID=2778364 RepID=UPI001C6901DC|nr:hypothetical protein [Ktedonospora formicarum]